MNPKDIAARLLGLLFISIAFLCLLGVLGLVLIPGEIDDLHSRVDAEYPEKIVTYVGLGVPELKQITLQDVKTACGLKNTLGISVNSLPFKLPVGIGESDLDAICAIAPSATGMEALERSFITSKLSAFSAEKFAGVKRDVGAYSYAYLPWMAVGFFAFYFASALVFYFGDKGILSWLRTVAFHTAVAALIYVLAFGLVWLVMPSLVSPQVTNNPDVVALVSALPDASRPVADIAITDAVLFLSDWARGAIAKFILVYLALVVVAALAWLGTAAAANAAEGGQDEWK